MKKADAEPGMVASEWRAVAVGRVQRKRRTAAKPKRAKAARKAPATRKRTAAAPAAASAAKPSRTSAVIIPAYKAGWCLREGVEAISRQTLKPDLVMIGADACTEGIAAALAARDEFAGSLDIRTFFFPRHVGPYRIRNVLAMLAPVDVLHFFDADDIMYPDHCERMAKYLTRGRFMGCEAEMAENPGDKPAPWHRASGVVSLLKVDFIQHGGFEPWVCGADSEAQQRWQAGGMKKYLPRVPTCLIRKHSGSLTIQPDTGYKSKVRERYKRELRHRHDHPVRLDSVATADVIEIGNGQALDSTAAAYEHTVPIPEHALTFGPKKPTRPTVDAEQALGMVRTLLADARPGFDRHRREMLRQARQWLAEQDATVQEQARRGKA